MQLRVLSTSRRHSRAQRRQTRIPIPSRPTISAQRAPPPESARLRGAPTLPNPIHPSHPAPPHPAHDAPRHDTTQPTRAVRTRPRPGRRRASRLPLRPQRGRVGVARGPHHVRPYRVRAATAAARDARVRVRVGPRLGVARARWELGARAGSDDGVMGGLGMAGRRDGA